MKYIVGIETHGQTGFNIFPDWVDHVSGARTFPSVLGAGYVHIECKPIGGNLIPQVICYGQSDGLGIKSRGAMDTNTINEQLLIQLKEHTLNPNFLP